MVKQIIQMAAVLGICAATATSVSADLNYTNARPTDTQVVDFNSETLGAVSSTAITTKYLNDGAVRTNQHKFDKITESGTTPEIKDALFGKTAGDYAVYAPKTDGSSSKTTSLRIDFAASPNGSWIKGYSAGDKIKQSFQIAFDKNTANAYTYSMQLTGTCDGQNATSAIGVNNGYTTVFQANKSMVSFFSQNTAMSFLDSKWYNVEIVYTIGSDTEKNKAELYIDGKAIDTAEFTLSMDKSVCVPMFGITQIRNNFTFPNGMKALPDESYETGIGHYIDNMLWSGKGSSYTYSEIIPQSNNAAITIADGAILINGDITAGEVKAAVTAGANTISVVSAQTGAELAEDASAEGAMLKIASSQSGDIFYKIGKTAMLYSEDFEAEDGFAEGKEYKYWESFNLEYAPDAEPAIVENVGGKSGKSFAISTQSTVNSTAWTSTGSMTKGKNKQIAHTADQNAPLVVEAMFMNTQLDYVTSMLRIGYMIGGTQYESNAISVASNGYVNGCGINIGNSKKQGLWHKIALVIDPKTLTADIYLDGEKKNDEPQAIASNATGELEGITTMWLRTWAGNTKLLSGYSAFDDIKVYNGYYDAAKDSATLASNNEAVVIENGIISIPATYNPTTLKNALTMAEGTSVKVFTNADFTAEYMPILPINTGAWLVEYAENGAIHYYQIMTPAGVSSFNTPKLYVDGVECSELPLVADGETAGLQAVVEMNKWNDETATLSVLAMYDEDGALVDCTAVKRAGCGYNRVELNLREIESFEGITVKAYVWDSYDGLVPVTDMVEIK